ncbi:murein transglycosylase [Micromonospora musae]|uniref:Murein transglycosylase n=1 Tax=Micromonospora musae TaxID=1894970 RepID=A0ABX9R565_9ACTN|nr:murein transglycosylase [Micromonospora musae]
MGDTRRVDGEDSSTLRPLRPAAPLDGAIAESGAAPDQTPRQVPRPRRPWLRSDTPAEPAPTGDAESQPAAASDAPTTGSSAQPASSAAKADEPAADADPKPEGTPETAQPAPDALPKADADPKPDGTSGTEPEPTAAGAPATADAGPKPDATTKTGPELTAAGAPATTDAEPKPDATPKTGSGPKAAGDATADDRPGTEPKPEGAAGTVDAATKVGAPVAARSSRHRVPFAHAVRLRPRRAATAAARATRAWSRRPSGRLTLPGLFLLLLVAVTATAGALIVPATVRAPRPVAADATAEADAPIPGMSPSGQPGLPGSPPPTTATSGAPTAPAVGGRPADALADWAKQVGPKVGIPQVAMEAYGYAELVLAQTNRSCALNWTTLAAIGFVESSHGKANGASLGPDGRAMPEIVGLPLDGQGGRMRIVDTDRGQLDKDTTYDRAIGPMQFIPTTWNDVGVDADNNGVKDPHDLDDAALAAGNYLCRAGRNLSIPTDWWNAILSYNDVRPYVQKVFDTANQYGQASRT